MLQNPYSIYELKGGELWVLVGRLRSTYKNGNFARVLECSKDISCSFRTINGNVSQQKLLHIASPTSLLSKRYCLTAWGSHEICFNTWIARVGARLVGFKLHFSTWDPKVHP